ncbi:hypothetical protein, partial [Candidatus Parabeggiatoa sp. HSG14]|uniref:hypothetical protein n=1 Tax=Candidatus Parabeggiatoa sp. HSG14 TaxID=3055593 RepID=UPI0025A80FB8|nr:hypothetical protein [Thiotrichales bacterium HSG14]
AHNASEALLRVLPSKAWQTVRSQIKFGNDIELTLFLHRTQVNNGLEFKVKLCSASAKNLLQQIFFKQIKYTFSSSPFVKGRLGFLGKLFIKYQRTLKLCHSKKARSSR